MDTVGRDRNIEINEGRQAKRDAEKATKGELKKKDPQRDIKDEYTERKCLCMCVWEKNVEERDWLALNGNRKICDTCLQHPTEHHGT